MRHNDVNNMTSLTPYHMLHFKILDKIDSFTKNISIPLTAKKVDYIFEEPLNRLHVIIG